MIENFINYIGATNLGLVLLLILVYLLGTKKTIKNLNDRIDNRIEGNRDFTGMYKSTDDLKKVVDTLKRSNGNLVKSEETQRNQIVKLQNDLRKVSGSNPQEENKEVKKLKEEVKILKKVVKRLEGPNQQQKTTTRTP